MGLATIANIPGNDDTLLEWSFSHMAHHRDINEAIYFKYGIPLPIYPLDPMNTQDLGAFSYWHQTMHTNQNAILGIDGNNLLDVNWDDQGQLTIWINSNFVEHLEATRALDL